MDPIALALPDLAADAATAGVAYGAGWLSHRTGRPWARRCVPVVKLVTGAVVRALVEALVLGGDWRTGALRGLVAGAAAVSGRQVWSKTARGNLREPRA